MLKGFRIVARRYRTKLGEIDLIARRGDLVLIVEVKARKTLIEAMDAIARESERRIEGARRPLADEAKGLRETVDAFRHGGGAALALAGACRECVLRAQLKQFCDKRCRDVCLDFAFASSSGAEHYVHVHILPPDLSG